MSLIFINNAENIKRCIVYFSLFFPPSNCSARSNLHNHSMVVLIDLVKSFGCISLCWHTCLVVFTADAGICRTRAIFALSGACCVPMHFGQLQIHADDNSLRGYTRYAVLWLKAMRQHDVTATGQTWVYSLARLHYFWACLTFFPLFLLLFSQYLSASLLFFLFLPFSPPSVIVLMSRWWEMST